MAASVEHCVAETREVPDLSGEPNGFEVWCSVHGKVIDYNVLTIRLLGAKEVQRKIDRAWLVHAEKETN